MEERREKTREARRTARKKRRGGWGEGTRLFASLPHCIRTPGTGYQFLDQMLLHRRWKPLIDVVLYHILRTPLSLARPAKVTVKYMEQNPDIKNPRFITNTFSQFSWSTIATVLRKSLGLFPQSNPIRDRRSLRGHQCRRFNSGFCFLDGMGC